MDLGDDGGGVVKLEKLELLLLQIYSFSLVQHTLVSRIPGVDLNIDMNFVPLLLIFFNSGYTFLEAMWSLKVVPHISIVCMNIKHGTHEGIIYVIVY